MFWKRKGLNFKISNFVLHGIRGMMIVGGCGIE